MSIDPSRRGWHARLLAKAAKILGGDHALRALLHAPASQYQRWKEGEFMPPDVFLKVADIVAEHDERLMSGLGRRFATALEQSESAQRHAVRKVEAAEAMVASSQRTRGWSVLLRAARAQERNHAASPAIKHRLFDPTFEPGNSAELLEAALDATLTVAGTDLGNVQLVDGDGALLIAAHRGFERDFLEFFAVVAKPECACGVAMSLGQQVFVPNVRRNSMFMGTDAGSTLEKAGCAAVTSTPLIIESGRVVGMISTHYRQPREQHDADLAALELVAARAASWLDVTPAP